MKVYFGFTDVPYRTALNTGPFRAWKVKAVLSKYGRNKTTSQVADELEQKYHIVENFYDMKKEEITEVFESVAKDMIRKVIKDPRIVTKEISVEAAITRQASKTVQSMFKTFLLNRELDNKVPGVPTRRSFGGSSIRGVGGSRPSFIDTGTYVNAFRVWSE